MKKLPVTFAIGMFPQLDERVRGSLLSEFADNEADTGAVKM